MASNDSLDSPLSSIPSEEEEDNDDLHHDSRSMDDTISATRSPSVSTPIAMPPSKRRRTGASIYDHATPVSTGADLHMQPPPSPSGSISSDSSADVPNSPSFTQPATTHPPSSTNTAPQASTDDPEGDAAQVTRCLWTDCPEPEQGNMDRLVDHIHTEHIGLRQKKYSCEWEGCIRKSMPHASGYALKAHMRSHTREKPFYCQLPECDRCFTRSDALAKHMRTVHETEALRPSDPVPKGHSEAASRAAGGSGINGSLKRIKLIVNNGDRPKSIVGELPPLPTDGVPDENGEVGAVDMDSLPFQLPVRKEYYPSDVSEALDKDELALPPSQLYRLLRRQIHWAEQEAAELAKEMHVAETAVEFHDKSQVDVPGTRAEKNRQRGWLQVEAVVDAILRKEAEVAEIRPAGQEGVGTEMEMEMKMEVEVETEMEQVFDNT